jgi:hypothetical protein
VCAVTCAAGQLLSLTLKHERPELEARKAALQQQQAAQRLQLTELEKALLQALAKSRCERSGVCLPQAACMGKGANACPHAVTPATLARCLPPRCLCTSGNLLGDTVLLGSLNETKAKALTATAALQDSRALAGHLDAQRSAYRPVTPCDVTGGGDIVHARAVMPTAHAWLPCWPRRSLAVRGSTLYFALLQLKQLDSMYCFSLAVSGVCVCECVAWVSQLLGSRRATSTRVATNT